MTEDDYLKKSAAIAKRLEIVRDQIYAHVGVSPRRAGNPIIKPLLENQQKIIDELIALELEFWGP